MLLDRAGNQSDFCSVSVDDVEGGRLAVQHLLDQGHTRIGVVGGPGNLRQVADRRLGAELARSRHNGSSQLLVISTSHLDVDAGVRSAEEIVAMPSSERPTAVFATNDLLAIGLLQGFVTAGLRVPDDMAIVGYDDIAFAAAAAVPLSSVRQPRLAIGYRAAELLFEEIQAIDSEVAHDHQQVDFNQSLSYAARVPRAAIFRQSLAARPRAGRPAQPGGHVVDFHHRQRARLAERTVPPEFW